MKTISVNVVQLPRLLPDSWVAQRSLAIVIDVLRFTSTACQALHVGARSIAVENEIEQARALAHRIGDAALLCGERHCQRIDGFDLGNSPHEYSADKVSGRDLVFSTTNGTRAVLAVSTSAYLALGCFLNRQAVADWATALVNRAQVDRIDIICAGTDGQIAAEDVLAAGAIVSSLQFAHVEPKLALNDSSIIALSWWNSLTQQIQLNESTNGTATSSAKLSATLVTAFSRSLGGANLIKSGFASDLTHTAQIDQVKTVPILVTDKWPRFVALA